MDWQFSACVAHCTLDTLALGPGFLIEVQDCARAWTERCTRSNQTDCQMPSVPVYQMFMGVGLRRCLPRGMCALSVGSYTRTISSWTPFFPFCSASVMSTLNLSYLHQVQFIVIHCPTPRDLGANCNQQPHALSLALITACHRSLLLRTRVAIQRNEPLKYS